MERNNKILDCKISDIEYYLPQTIIDNSELASRYDGWSAEKIYEKTGIRSRHVVNNNEHVSDLAVNAALKLFKRGFVNPKEIDTLILCTQTPDYALPSTSVLVHERLGLSKSCATFDFNQGCTGFIYGLYIAGNMIHSGSSVNVLLITSETYSIWCHPMDKSVTTIFGDGAAAVYLRHAKGEDGIGPFVFGTDGKGFNNLVVPLSGSHGLLHGNDPIQEVVDESGNIRTSRNLYMNGPELFRFAMSTVPPMIEEVLSAAEENIENIDRFVFHQANSYMLKNLQRTIKIPDHKMIYEMENIGNTVSSSIPIALRAASDKGNISFGNKLLLAGFGVGYSWAATILKWNPDI